MKEKLYYTDLTGASSLMGYLFDFKCNKVHSKIQEDDVPFLELSNFEHVVTNNCNKELKLELENYQGCIQLDHGKLPWNAEPRTFHFELDNNKLTKLYLTEAQLNNLDTLLELEEQKDIKFFEAVVHEIPQQIKEQVSYDKMDKVLTAYSNEFSFPEKLRSFLLEDKAQTLADKIKQMEQEIYEFIDFDAVVNAFYLDECEIVNENEMEL